jgi:hypothetical protein
MWRVSYYMCGGTLTSKTFPTMHAATEFVVYKISSWDVREFYKLD